MARPGPIWDPKWSQKEPQNCAKVVQTLFRNPSQKWSRKGPRNDPKMVSKIYHFWLVFGLVFGVIFKILAKRPKRVPR